MTSPFPTVDVQQSCAVLSSPALIRLITEIDDNGAIPPRGVARTLADLTPHQVRQSTDLARSFGLVRVRPGVGLCLTTSGLALADVYDATACWARRHAYPAPVADFTSRVKCSLGLLAETTVLAGQSGHYGLAAERPLSAQAVADLARPRELLRHWLHANPHAARCAEPESAA
ncbi:hypothetical protein [Streptomyces collinus]|uniref:hypothetical protein n=1 Tax=Streptomyces collinus TaxID=42684 RepID=UPI0037CD64DE